MPYIHTSVIVAGLVDFGPPSQSARDLMVSVAEGVVPRPLAAWHCCLEFYAITTRLPRPLRISPEAALALLSLDVLPYIDVIEMPPDARLPFLQIAAIKALQAGRI